MIKIIVDSTCDLPKEVVEQYNIDVVPLRVSINEVEYYDRVTIQVEEVYKEMKKGILPKTSQVAPMSFHETFAKACEKGQDFIYLAFSSKLSGTHDLGVNVLHEFKEKYPNIKMAIVDSKSGSTAIGMLVLECIKMDKEGLAFEKIIEKINLKIKKIEHIFTLADLNWLVKGGRIGKAKGVVGTMLDIKPILDIQDGSLRVIKTVRGKKRVLKAIIDILEERGIENNSIVGISYAENSDLVEGLKEGIVKRFGEKEFMVNQIGSVLGSHVGLTGVGIFFYNK